jgi:hypothetical protein
MAADMCAQMLQVGPVSKSNSRQILQEVASDNALMVDDKAGLREVAAVTAYPPEGERLAAEL